MQGIFAFQEVPFHGKCFSASVELNLLSVIATSIFLIAKGRM